MANDRIHIRCDGCGAWRMLMSHSGAGITSANDTVLRWIDSHGGCHPNAFGTADLGGIVGFSLHLDGDIGSTLDPALQNASPERKR